ncbi:hypothetical protein [Amycolatopsis magusensis]
MTEVLAKIWFPDGPMGTVLVVVAVLMVITGIIIGRRSRSKHK